MEQKAVKLSAPSARKHDSRSLENKQTKFMEFYINFARLSDRSICIDSYLWWNKSSRKCSEYVLYLEILYEIHKEKSEIEKSGKNTLIFCLSSCIGDGLENW